MAAPKHLLLLLLLLPVALWAKAGVGKTEGVLNGYVRDAVTKKPLPGVVVSATIPGTNHQQAVLTDSAGYFHFVELPSAMILSRSSSFRFFFAEEPDTPARSRS